MLSLPPSLKILISTKPLDMRKSLDGMSAIVTQELKKDVFAGQVFVFCNQRGDKVKLFCRLSFWCRTSRADFSGQDQVDTMSINRFSKHKIQRRST